ncbi:alpha-galactosidase [Fusicatenibacter sp.]
MAIKVSENGRLFTLQTKDSSYQMFADDKNVLLHLYYGEKIGEENLSGLIFCTDMGFAGNPEEAGPNRKYSLDTLPQEIPGSGVGDFRDDMIEIRHADGSFAADFRFDSYEILDHSYAIPGMPALYDTEEEKGETLVITMTEKASDIVLKLFYGVFENENVITRAARLENHGETAIELEKMLSFSMDLMYENYEMIYFSGRHAMERTAERIPVQHAKVEIGSTRGTSSHHYNPAVILCEEGAGETHGSCIGACLVYSGNFVAAAQKDQKNQTRFQMGIHPTNFCFHLEKGEAFDTPQAILSYSGTGFTKLSQQYHEIIREHICRGTYKHAKRPILINNWEATYFNFNEEKILKIAEQAQKLGIEMLVLDDGWFGKREDDNSGLGDWFVNEKKMNGSMAQLAEKIHKMGMKFGLWFEPEMISEDSDLYRAHPDWAFAIPGRVPNHSRNQLVLDMTREDVREYLLERLTTIVHDAKIDYVKWDMNRSVCDVYSHVAAQNRNGELYHRYVLGVYDLLERFLAACPDLLLEGCSGGGGRYDAGMMYYSPQIWCSDNTDAINRLSIQYGSSFFYPISTVGSHVSVCPNHQTGRVTPFQTRGDVALAGSFGYEMDLNKISEEEKEMVKEQVAAMHEYYELTHEGLYYRLTGLKKQDFMAWEFVAKDQSCALLTIVKTDAEGNMLPVHTKVCGLAEDKLYRCSLDGEIRSGRTWNRAGLTLHQVLGEYESIRVEFTEVK